MAFSLSPTQVLDGLTAHCCLIDEKGTILLVNGAWRAFAQQMGFEHSAVCEGASYLAVCQEIGKDARPILRGLRRLLSGRTDTFTCEYRCEYFGQTRWLVTRVSRLAQPAPGEPYALVVNEDVTARKEVELHAVQAAESLRQIVRQARCSLWSGTVEERGNRLAWKIRFQDEAAARRLLPIKRAPGRDFLTSWYLARPQEDREQSDAFGNAKVRAGEDYTQEFRCRLSDGSQLWIKEDVTVQTIREGLWKVTGIWTDITPQKYQEELLRLALEGGSLGTWQVDVSQRQVLSASDRLKALFGLSAQEPLTWERFTQKLHPMDRARVIASTQEALLSHETTVLQYRLLLNDGSVRWLESYRCALQRHDGPATHLIGVSRDITAQKQAEAEAAQALLTAQAQADRDPLTGLLNHRAFHKRLEEEAARATREGSSLAIIVLDIDNFKFFNDAYGHTTGDAVLRVVADKLRKTCRLYDTLSRFGGDEFALILPKVGSSRLAELEKRLSTELALTYRPPERETAIPITISLGAALFPQGDTDWHEMVRKADERLRRAKTGGGSDREADRTRERMGRTLEGFSMLDALVTAVDNKDRYTKQHSEDVLTYSLQIAQRLGTDEATQQTIAVAALLHDVGKIGVPDAILRKPDRLTDAEFEAVKQHPTMGAAIVATVVGLEDTLDAVRHHHERWDGLGYPAGLRGTDTPWMARLMAVADAYSAMTTDRPYRQGMSPERAKSILREGAGSQWDPEMVCAFLSATAS